MLKSFLSLLFMGCAALAVAQPPARMRQQAQQPAAPATSTTAPAAASAGGLRKLPTGSIRQFPTAQSMPTDAVWRRDIYRRLDLTKDANAPLYYPITPQKDRKNLFVYLMHLVLRGQIKAYEYTRDATEHFDEAHELKGRKILDDNNIFYEVNDGKMRLNDADLPSEDVKIWFVKESVYYNQHTATFRTQVTALCPVMVAGSSAFDEATTQQVPLFWIDYAEAAPHLAKLSLMASNLNNASEISADDFFATNQYRGDIYKDTNLQDRLLVQTADSDSALVRERNRIENQLKQFEQNIWGAEEKPAPTKNTAEAAATDADSTATEAQAEEKVTSRRARRATKAPKQVAEAANKRATSVAKPKTKTSSSSATYSVRRQRR